MSEVTLKKKTYFFLAAANIKGIKFSLPKRPYGQHCHDNAQNYEENVGSSSPTKREYVTNSVQYNKPMPPTAPVNLPRIENNQPQLQNARNSRQRYVALIWKRYPLKQRVQAWSK